MTGLKESAYIFLFCICCLHSIAHAENIPPPVNNAAVAYAMPTPFYNGTYRAIVIGNNKYKDPKGVWKPLNTAVNDARSVAKTLSKDYGFEDVKLLLNATRIDILNALNEMVKKTRKNDSVLIYYAGHGYQNRETDEAYWIPVDAVGWLDAYFLSNARIKEKISVISARASHTLLVSDSCFSGSLLRRGMSGRHPSDRSERYYKKIAKRKSVQIVAAGGVEFVDDNYLRSGHSPFTYFLLKELKDNQSKLLTSTELSNNLKRLVANNVQQTPQSGILYGAGDEGGEFIFQRVKLNQKSVKSTPPKAKIDQVRSISDSTAIELSYWQSIKDMNNPELFQSYLDKYPNGTFSDIAKYKMEEFNTENRKKQIAQYLAEADKYFRQNILLSPPDENAHDRWQKVLTLEPNNAKANNGLKNIARHLINRALKHINHYEFDQARDSLAQARQLDPDLSLIAETEQRLNTIETQYSRLQKTPTKEKKQSEILEDMLQKTPFAEPKVHEPSDFSALESENIQQRIYQHNTKAEQYFRKKQYIASGAGGNQNARDQWQAILELDPDNRLAKSGLRRVAKKLVSLALKNMNQNNFSTSQKYLNQAREIQPELRSIKDAEYRLEILKSRR